MNHRRTGRLLAAALIAMAAIVGLAGRPGAAAPATQQTSAFLNVWSRTDLPVAQGQVRRGYVWGPSATITRNEPWAESPGGQRLVQYWDKARMEITNPGANPADPFYVTNGRLVYEMVSGLIQTGNNRFENKTPAQDPVAGDTRSANPDTPSYATFRGRASIFPARISALDRTGQAFTAYMDITGRDRPRRLPGRLRRALRPVISRRPSITSPTASGSSSTSRGRSIATGRWYRAAVQLGGRDRLSDCGAVLGDGAGRRGALCGAGAIVRAPGADLYPPLPARVPVADGQCRPALRHLALRRRQRAHPTGYGCPERAPTPRLCPRVLFRFLPLDVRGWGLGVGGW